MGYAVLHLDKAHGADTKMSDHIERKTIPNNADPTRTHLNRELIVFPEGVANRNQAISQRLESAGLTRKIGINQVRVIRIVVSGSPEDMKKIEQTGRLDEWCRDNVDWLKQTYGSENIVSAVLHMDEKTPHIHATLNQSPYIIQTHTHFITTLPTVQTLTPQQLHITPNHTTRHSHQYQPQDVKLSVLYQHHIRTTST